MRRFIGFIILALVSSALSAQAPSFEEIVNSIERGQRLYQTHCANCHRRNGQGLGKSYPPLAQADYLLTDPDRAIRVIWFGLKGPIQVNGKTYDNVMAPIKLTEQEVMDVMNYVLHAWGNTGPLLDQARVRAALEAGEVN
jgi:mono/diheme cytochrome c family protein